MIIDLFDITGRTMKSLTCVASTCIKMDVSDMPAGVYFVHFNAGGFTSVKKVVIAR